MNDYQIIHSKEVGGKWSFDKVVTDLYWHEYDGGMSMKEFASWRTADGDGIWFYKVVTVKAKKKKKVMKKRVSLKRRVKKRNYRSGYNSKKNLGKVKLKIIASSKKGFYLVFPNARPQKVSRAGAQVYFKRLKVLRKYATKKYQGKIYHMG